MRDLAEEARFRRLEREWKLDGVLREARSALERAASGLALSLRETALDREALEQARLLASAGRGEQGGVEKGTIALAEAEDGSARAEFDLLAARLRLLSLRGEVASRFLESAP
jgi:hypothetical protein